MDFDQSRTIWFNRSFDRGIDDIHFGAWRNLSEQGLDVAIAQANHAAAGISNYSLFHGKAPEQLAHWPDPDAVFIGGSGGELQELIRLVLQRLRQGGRLVMNFVTLENLASATATLDELQADWDVLQLQAARSKPILHMHRMAAENPVWLVCARQHDKEHP